ncbi:helix-turn-helix transcriptional regulator [Pedobacter sp. SD-b]|uniref:Helix-turn-helix transcriptional regulator n=1 Tax=Pedobacter segetis TaxID=2793069 RepID=A0ABS1BHY4_9SPHI|nr:AraC family transcriptional regulator [Pedobacter segetis]MBK0382422.1 helix-turn-helix transcriptional regulator [Pedobacter segetis]
MPNKSESYQLAIKNMVCPRCISAVKRLLTDLGYQYIDVGLGNAFITSKPDFGVLSKSLNDLGFELLNKDEQIVINQIKSKIITLLQSDEPVIHQNLSNWLASFFTQDFHQLSSLFSQTEGISIEKYFILQRLEKVKELLVYNELSLKEIAYKFGFSSTAHLSAQFKKETGFTTSHFKELGFSKRKSLESLLD